MSGNIESKSRLLLKKQKYDKTIVLTGTMTELSPAIQLCVALRQI